MACFEKSGHPSTFFCCRANSDFQPTLNWIMNQEFRISNIELEMSLIPFTTLHISILSSSGADWSQCSAEASVSQSVPLPGCFRAVQVTQIIAVHMKQLINNLWAASVIQWQTDLINTDQVREIRDVRTIIVYNVPVTYTFNINCLFIYFVCVCFT